MKPSRITRFRNRARSAFDSRAAVIEQHESHHQQHAHDRSRHAFLHGISSERRTHRAVFEIIQRGRQSTGAQHLREDIDLVLREAAFNLAGVAYRALDIRNFADAAP